MQAERTLSGRRSSQKENLPVIDTADRERIGDLSSRCKPDWGNWDCLQTGCVNVAPSVFLPLAQKKTVDATCCTSTD